MFGKPQTLRPMVAPERAALHDLGHHVQRLGQGVGLRAARGDDGRWAIRHDLGVRGHIAAVGRLHHIHAHLRHAVHRPGDVLRRVGDVRPALEPPRIDVADHRQLEARRVAHHIAHHPQRCRLGVAPDEDRHRDGVGPQAHGIFGSRQLFERRPVDLGQAALDDQGQLAGVRLPQAGGDALVHRDRIRVRRDDGGQRRLHRGQARRQTITVADEMVDGDRAQAARRVGEKTVETDEFTDVHVESSC